MVLLWSRDVVSWPQDMIADVVIDRKGEKKEEAFANRWPWLRDYYARLAYAVGRNYRGLAKAMMSFQLMMS